ncbi:uncharacterized protein LOC112683587 isoform X2 [Sipha flava]|nr:uncharacterized protein LOC112683587 isoform X2 [Sipha flava]
MQMHKVPSPGDDIRKSCGFSIILDSTQVIKKVDQIPVSEEEWKIISNNFESKWNFNHCLGAIDGKHIEIIRPQDSGYVELGSWRNQDEQLGQLQPYQGRNSSVTAKEIRDKFCNYFNNVGAVHWQDDLIDINI